MIKFLGRMFVCLHPYKWQTTLLLLGMIASLAYDTMLPFSFKFLIDDVIEPHNYRLLILILATLAVGGIIVSVIGVGRDYLYARLSADVLKDLRLQIFNHLQNLPIEFYRRKRSGDITANFSTDLASVENAVVNALPTGTMSLIGLIFSTVLLFVLQWKLALLAMMGLPVCLIGPRFIRKKAADANDRYKNAQAEILNTVEENIGAQTVIKTFNLKYLLVNKFQEQVSGLSCIAVRANFLSFMMERTPGIGILIFHIIVICACTVLAFQGLLSIGALVSFNAIFVIVSKSVYDATSILPQLIQAAAGMERIDRLLREKTFIQDKHDAPVLPRLAREISFRDVSFGYMPEQPILKNVSILIHRGSSVAFVGPSGSGKSTAVNLLMRFYDPDSGVITFDGIDIREVTQDSLRARMGVVLQENFLFNTSILENIKYGNPEAGDTGIEASARTAEIHDMIASMPGGYGTPVGERGSGLSGGQRQRVAIARMLIRNPEILVLDEATSALDPVAESAINTTLRRIGRDRTVIFVTHRLSSITHVDRIYVFDNGRVVEQGGHDELLNKKGYYNALWQKQSGFFFSSDGEAAEVTAERLRMIPILEDLDDELLKDMPRLFVTERYPPGRVIVHEGDPGDKFYIIVRGQAEVTKNGIGGSGQVVNVLEDGDHFGEIALLKSIPRIATVATTISTVFLTLQRDLFLSLMDKAPHLRRILEEHASRYIRQGRDNCP
jgi:ATP-binding cassette subfamily B protein